MRRLVCVAVTLSVALGVTFAWGETMTVTGLILGPAGQPVAGALVMARDTPAEGPSQLAETTSDDRGRFDLKLKMAYLGSAVEVLAMHPALALGMEYAMPGLPVVVWLGADPVVFAVKTVTPDGDPITGATVHVVSVTPNTDTAIVSFPFVGPGPLDGVTDAEGVLRVAGLPAQARLSLNIAAEGWASVAAQMQGSASRELTVTMAPEGRISGHVLHNGQPMPDVEVRASRERDDSGGRFGHDTTRTGADGTYTLRHLPAGKYAVRVTAAPGLVAAGLRQVAVTAGAETTGQDLSLTPGAVVRGKVTDARTGEPLRDMSVYASQVDWPVGGASVASEADGAYELRLAPGAHRLAVWAKRMYSLPEEQRRELEVAEGELVEGVDFALQPPAAVTGLVLTPEGRPAVGTIVWFAYLAEYGERPSSWAAVGPTGAFRLDTTEPFVERGGRLVAYEASRDLIAVAPYGESKRVLEMALQPAAYVWGTARTPGGEPVPGISLSVGVVGEPQRHFMNVRGVTDADGRVCLGPLPSGMDVEPFTSSDCWDYGVERGWWDRGMRFSLQPGEQRELPPIILDTAGRSLAVKVTDAEGKPLAGVRLHAHRLSGLVLTDATGMATLTRMPMKGPIAVVAAHRDQPLFAGVTVDPGEIQEVTLVLRPPVTVTGTLQRPTGEHLAHCELQVRLPVTLKSSGTPWGELIENELLSRITADTTVKTDTDGRFAVQGLVAGLAYDLRVSVPGGGILGLDPLTPGAGPVEDVVIEYDGH